MVIKHAGVLQFVCTGLINSITGVNVLWFLLHTGHEILSWQIKFVWFVANFLRFNFYFKMDMYVPYIR